MAIDIEEGDDLETFLAKATEYYNKAAASKAVEAVAEAVAAIAEQEQPDMGERFEQSPQSEAIRIDRADGMLYGVRVMGVKSAHGYDYSLDAQRAACPRYEQMPVGLDHDYSGGPMCVESAWGTLCNPRVDGKGTVADLRYLKSHVRTEQVLEDAERDVGLFSLSAVTTRVIERPKGTITSFSPVRVDLVVRGATTKKLFEQEATSELAALKADVAELKSRQTKYEQTIAPVVKVAAVVAETTKGIDLTKFWRD